MDLKFFQTLTAIQQGNTALTAIIREGGPVIITPESLEAIPPDGCLMIDQVKEGVMVRYYPNRAEAEKMIRRANDPLTEDEQWEADSKIPSSKTPTSSPKPTPSSRGGSTRSKIPSSSTDSAPAPTTPKTSTSSAGSV